MKLKKHVKNFDKKYSVKTKDWVRIRDFKFGSGKSQGNPTGSRSATMLPRS